MNRAYSRAGIISRLFNTPLAVTPQTAAVVLGAMGERLDVSQLFVPAAGNTLSRGDLEGMAEAERVKISARGHVDRRAKSNPADRLMLVHDQVGHIAVRGELVAENDGSIGPSSGFTGYDGIVASVHSADADPNVRGILLDIDSPGGEVAGLYECAKILMDRRGTKPMRAMIRGMGCSAAYALAACADEITLHDLGYAGSIGTIAMHADFSAALEQDGIKVTLFTAGEHKADGNPFEPLPENVAREIQSMVEIANSRFIAHVAAARGLSEDEVRAQQAQIYRGQAAVKAGLVDKVMSWQDSMDEFEAVVNERGTSPGSNAPSGARSTRKDNSMSTNANAPAAENQPGITQEAHDLAISEARADATAQAEQAERQRVADLAAIDAKSTVSPELAAAIADGTSAGDFAVAQAKASKAALSTAHAAAKSEAVSGASLPEGGPSPTGAAAAAPANRGQAYVAKKQAAAQTQA